MNKKYRLVLILAAAMIIGLALASTGTAKADDYGGPWYFLCKQEPDGNWIYQGYVTPDSYNNWLGIYNMRVISQGYEPPSDTSCSEETPTPVTATPTTQTPTQTPTTPVTATPTTQTPTQTPTKVNVDCAIVFTNLDVTNRQVNVELHSWNAVNSTTLDWGDGQTERLNGGLGEIVNNRSHTYPSHPDNFYLTLYVEGIEETDACIMFVAFETQTPTPVTATPTTQTPTLTPSVTPSLTPSVTPTVTTTPPVITTPETPVVVEPPKATEAPSTPVARVVENNGECQEVSTYQRSGEVLLLTQGHLDPTSWQLTDNGVQDLDSVLDPTGEFFANIRAIENSNKWRLVVTETETLEEVTVAVGNVRNPALNMPWVAYESEEDGKWILKVTNIETTEVKLEVEGGYNAFFSPDAHFVGFIRNNNVFAADLTMAIPSYRVLAPTWSDATDVVWAGSRIIFVAYSDEHNALGVGVVKLDEASFPYDWVVFYLEVSKNQVAISKDGSKIVWVQEREDGGTDLWSENLETGIVEQLTDDHFVEQNPVIYCNTQVFFGQNNKIMEVTINGGVQTPEFLVFGFNPQTQTMRHLNRNDAENLQTARNIIALLLLNQKQPNDVNAKQPISIFG